MCDFISICTRVDGKIAHIPSNSHSGAVKEFGWTENNQTAYMLDKMRFVESEWNGIGDYPGAEKITRGEINEKQRKAIDLFYSNAAKLFSDPKKHAKRMLTGNGYFASDIYADIRFNVIIHDECPKLVANELAKLPLYASGQKVKSLHPKIAKIEGGFKIAAGYKITAPALAEVGSSVDVHKTGKLNALKLKK